MDTEDRLMLRYMGLCVCGALPKVRRTVSRDYGRDVFTSTCPRGCRSSSTESVNFITASSAKAAILETMEKICIDWNEAVSPHQMD